MAEKVTPTQETLPNEAGFSTNFFLNNEKFGRIQFTFRGATSADWGKVLEDLDRFLGYMHEKGWLLDGEARAAGVSVPEPAQSPKKPYERKPVPASELPSDLPSMAEGQYSEYFNDAFDAIEITPVDGGKATVKFLKDGMKYPVGAPINKWKNANVATMLLPLGEFDLTVAKVHRVAGVQYWVPGNEFTKDDGSKGHYKDLKLVQAIF